MKYNFTKFIRQHKKFNTSDIVIRKQQATINKRDFPDYKMIDIYTDKENNAIKIVQGTTYVVGKVKKESGYSYRYFNSSSLVKESVVKIGKYKYIENGIFELLK